MATVSFSHVTRVYPGATKPSVDDFNLDIRDGEFLVLVGPSGCGKTTTLRMLAGLEDVNAGSIFIDDVDVTHMHPKDRDIAMVFQSYALYPHMTVRENMSFALKINKTSKEEIEKRINDAAEILELGDLLDRKPKQLSGGQRQRVAMGRAIVRKPKVFLMDEPLSNLDAKLRVSTRTQIATLQRELGITTIYVTHDQTEALTMGNRIAVMKDGLLQQVGTPRALYEQPDNSFIASFIGSPSMNLGTALVTDNGINLGGEVIPLSVAEKLKNYENVIVGFRPELPIITNSTDPESFPIEIDLIEELGSHAFVYGHFIGGKERSIVVRTEPHFIAPGAQVLHIKFPDEGYHVFDPTSGERIN